ncbi:putative retroelement [Phytophthora cinnamomi]|uniref:putative retroelement n=1 Tax=Phytophthora cinnamomi TaxID=4785 RepID=UPI00355A4BFC|nr:putative retroelement [Phytophthora cinnamomi]
MAEGASWCGVLLAKRQDNASIHASHETKHFLQEVQINTMVWPARSPDCNPIENVWSAMAAKVYASSRQHHNVADFEAAIMAVWDAIQLDYLLKSVESMPRRCLAVIKKKGGLTKY